MRLRPSSSLLCVVALAAAVACVTLAGSIVAERLADAPTPTAEETAGRRLVEASSRAGALLESLRSRSGHDARPLEPVYAARVADVRAAADATGDAELVALAAKLGAADHDVDADTLSALALRAAGSSIDRIVDRRVADERAHDLLVSASIAATALALVVGLLAGVRALGERRALEWALPAGRSGESLAARAARLTGRASHAFRQQVDLVGERVELARVLAETERQEERLTSEVRQNRERIEKLEVSQMNDELTGVLNFKYFLLRLSAALDEFVGNNRGFCLLALDLDDFKGINDRYGHHVGDAALKAFARVLSGSVRDGDVVFRKSGDEFYVLMPGASPAEGEALAAGLLDAVSLEEVTYESPGETYRVGLATSIGVLHCAQVDPHLLGSLTRDQLLSETYGFADAALFKAKYSGKGCARIYTTGLTVNAVNPSEYPPELDQLHREVRARYPLLPDDVKAVFNANVGACRSMLRPNRSRQEALRAECAAERQDVNGAPSS